MLRMRATGRETGRHTEAAQLFGSDPSSTSPDHFPINPSILRASALYTHSACSHCIRSMAKAVIVHATAAQTSM